MAIEKIQAQIIAEVDDQSFKQAWEKAKLFARDTKKELDKSFLFKLQLDKAETKIQLDSARKLLRQAKKDWDKALVLKYTLKTDQLQSKLTEAWRSLRNFWNTWKTNVSRLGALFNKLWFDISKINPKVTNVINNMSSWFSWVSTVVSWLITKLWILAVAAWLTKVWSRAIFLWDKLEQANISFETMLWSEEKAFKLLQDLTTFASNTPFELIWLRESAKQLLAYWIESDQLIPTLKAIWDVSSGLSVPIDRIALAYGQVKVAGRLMGQDLLQFTSAWVPLIAELAKNMWVAQSEVKSMVSDWTVWFADVNEAFKTMTEQGWKFANLMTKQSDTLSGRWSNLKDKADSILEWIWTALIPFAKKVVWAMSFVLDWLVNIWTGLRAITGFIVSWMVQSIFSIQKAWNIVIWNIKILLNWLTWTFKDFWINVWVFARNFWKVFSHIPTMMWKYFNKWIVLLEDFLNKASNWINNFAKKLWFEGDVVWKISLWRFDEGWKVEALESFKSLNSEFASLKNAEIQKEIKEYSESRNILKWMESKRLQEQILELWKSNDSAKKLDTELKSITKTNIEDTTKAKAKADKEAKKLKKEELEREKKFQKYLEKKEKERIKRIEERAKRLEKWKEAIKDYYNTVRDELDNSQDKLDKFEDKIKSTSKKIRELKEELKSEKDETWVSLAERKLKVEEEILELEKEFKWIKKEAKIDEKTLTSIGKWTLSSGASWDEVLEAKKLYEELALLEENANLVTEANKEQAKESESARIIRISEEKEIAIQKEIKSEQTKLFILFENKDKEKAKYTEIDEYRTTLEHNFTAVIQSEAKKRISELEKIRQKAISTANALAKAWVTHKTTHVTNNTNVNLKGSWFSSIDAQNIGNALTEKIDLSSKWIN